MAMNKYHL